jgi:F0F1-type ATP synthase assembly protein I
MMCSVLTIASGILGLGSSPDSFGQTLALLITFLGIGVIANVLIVYVVAQVLAERKQNQERMDSFQSQQHHRP